MHTFARACMYVFGQCTPTAAISHTTSNLSTTILTRASANLVHGTEANNNQPSPSKSGRGEDRKEEVYVLSQVRLWQMHAKCQMQV